MKIIHKVQATDYLGRDKEAPPHEYTYYNGLSTTSAVAAIATLMAESENPDKRFYRTVEIRVEV